MSHAMNIIAASPPTPPTTPPTMAPTLVLELELLSDTGTTVVGVITVVEVLETVITDPPGRVVAEVITDSEVVAGRRDVVEDIAELEELDIDVEELVCDVLPPSLEQDVVKRVAVAEVVVTGIVITICTGVVTTCSARSCVSLECSPL